MSPVGNSKRLIYNNIEILNNEKLTQTNPIYDKIIYRVEQKKTLPLSFLPEFSKNEYMPFVDLNFGIHSSISACFTLMAEFHTSDQQKPFKTSDESIKEKLIEMQPCKDDNIINLDFSGTRFLHNNSQYLDKSLDLKNKGLLEEMPMIIRSQVMKPNLKASQHSIASRKGHDPKKVRFLKQENSSSESSFAFDDSSSENSDENFDEKNDIENTKDNDTNDSVVQDEERIKSVFEVNKPKKLK